jgi:hypothetical protein
MNREDLASPKRSVEGRSLRSSRNKDDLANHEVVTLAVFLLGGASEPIDTEDVAKKANELAPGRFAWRKYKDQINLETVRVYLSDAKKAAKGAYLIGSGNSGWTLSEAGLTFAKNNVGEIDALEAATPRNAVGQDRQRLRRERARLMESDAFQKIAADRADEVTRRDAESFFRIDSYVRGEARLRRVATIANAHGGDPDLGPAIDLLSKIVKEATDGNN